MKKILFLCTGNYYRSRYSEEYFNHYSKQLNLGWTADSKGIMREFKGNGNVGPIAKHTLAELTKHDIQALGSSRYPAYVYENDLHNFDRTIAVSLDEHKPMLEALWPDSLQKVEYFDVEDLHIEGFHTALPRLTKHLDILIKSLRI